MQNRFSYRGWAAQVLVMLAALAYRFARLHATGGRHELIENGEQVRRVFRLRAMGEEPLKALAARLRTLEGVTGYRLDPRDD